MKPPYCKIQMMGRDDAPKQKKSSGVTPARRVTGQSGMGLQGCIGADVVIRHVMSRVGCSPVFTLRSTLTTGLYDHSA